MCRLDPPLTRRKLGTHCFAIHRLLCICQYMIGQCVIRQWMTCDLVGLVGFEPTTPALSTQCSNQLSYRPKPVTLNQAQTTRPLFVTSDNLFQQPISVSV